MPPETTRAPRPASVSAMTAAFSTVRRWSARNGSSAASLKATALPAMTCISGPPWVPGKTLRSTEAASAPSAAPFLTAGNARRVEAGPAASRRLKTHPAARPAQRLVGRRRDQVGVRERARVDAGRDEAGDVGHVDEQQRADVGGDRGHPLEVPDPRIGATRRRRSASGRTSRAWAAIAS